MSSAPPERAPASSRWRALVGELTWKRAAVAAVLAVLAAALLNPIFETPFAVVLGRLLFIAALLLVVFALAGNWHPVRLPSWLARVLAIVLAAPVATFLAYVPSIDRDMSWMLAHGQVTGFALITATALIIAPMLALGALYRERDAQARTAQLAFALERSTLEREALDARLKLLQAQVEPHFLFNTLANVQELVETGSPQAAPVLKSLIAYLRAAIPKLHDGGSTLATEVVLVQAYLELMHMRMPDRLRFTIDLPADLRLVAFLPMSVLTLVENAIRHGIDPSERGGRIDVKVQRDADGKSIRVIVADSGTGMSETAAHGTGLTNLESRLRGVLGPTARLELHEVSPHGLSAEIVFAPAERPAS